MKKAYPQKLAALKVRTQAIAWAYDQADAAREMAEDYRAKGTAAEENGDAGLRDYYEDQAKELTALAAAYEDYAERN